MPTFTQIGSAVTVGAGGASSIDFTSIPNTYTDLVVKFSTRTTTGGAADVVIKLNTDTGNNYPYKFIQGNGATAGSAGSTYTALSTGTSSGSTDTASTFANSEVYIPNYAGSTYKSASSDSVTENNATTAYTTLRAAIWNNTSSINAISLTNANGASFAQYSTAYLYGVSNA